MNNAIVVAFLTQNFLSPVKNWPKIFRRPRLFKVTDFDTNRKLMCDFLLVINTNLPPILYRFQVMDMSNFRQRQLASLWRFRWVITRNIGINFTSPVTIMIVLPADGEDRTIVCLFVWAKHGNVTDGQNWSSYYSGLHCEQCGRAVKKLSSQLMRILAYLGAKGNSRIVIKFCTGVGAAT